MISNIRGTTGVNQNYGLEEKQSEKKAEAAQGKEEQAAILELGKSSDSNATYSKPKAKKADMDEINRLWEQSQKSYASLRKLVEDLLARQGKKFTDVLSGKEILLVDEETRAAAAAAVSEDGELGVKAVSGNIVAFAKAVAGDDKAKAGEMRDAIIQGFKEAEKVWGGKLPEISQRTYDEVMRKLDEWEQS
ncbi:MAG: hypothetical protein VB106_06070 [Clostridiaceae bacterium]|nr:hypothetical protein [Clostridiaceae bacterium]